MLLSSFSLFDENHARCRVDFPLPKRCQKRRLDCALGSNDSVRTLNCRRQREKIRPKASKRIQKVGDGMFPASPYRYFNSANATKNLEGRVRQIHSLNLWRPQRFVSSLQCNALLQRIYHSRTTFKAVSLCSRGFHFF